MAYKYISFLKQNRTHKQAESIYNQRIKDSRLIYEKFSKEFNYRNCPICNNDDYKELEKFDSRYGICKCNICNSKYVNPAPPIKALNYYYNNCICNTSLRKIIENRPKKSVVRTERLLDLFAIIKRILKNKKNISILDVGANSGYFLSNLKELLKEQSILPRVELVGVDIDQEAVNKPYDDEIKLFCVDALELSTWSDKKFDLIYHFELIEHVLDPSVFINEVYKLLCDGGLMYFQTPNEIGLDNKAIGYNSFRPLAHGVFPPMHLQGFSTQNIVNFLNQNKFKVLEISTPGNFDVDMVMQFSSFNSEYRDILSGFNQEQLARIQILLKKLCCSAQLAVLANR